MISPSLTTARLILRPPQHEDFDLGWDHVIHCIDKRNAPSIKLALSWDRSSNARTSRSPRCSRYTRSTCTANPPSPALGGEHFGQPLQQRFGFRC